MVEFVPGEGGTGRGITLDKWCILVLLTVADCIIYIYNLCSTFILAEGGGGVGIELNFGL